MQVLKGDMGGGGLCCSCFDQRHRDIVEGNTYKPSNSYSRIPNKFWNTHCKQNHFKVCAAYFMKIWREQCHLCERWFLCSTLATYKIAVLLCGESSRSCWFKMYSQYVQKGRSRSWRCLVKERSLHMTWDDSGLGTTYSGWHYITSFDLTTTPVAGTATHISETVDRVPTELEL